jgi:hypothetical protein
MAITWRELKESLFVQDRCGNSDQLREVFLKELVVRRQSLEVERFNPLLIGRHLDRLSEICQNCLALRKEIRDLEILAVKALAEYQLFETTSVLDERADFLRLHLEALDLESSGQSAARDKFGAASELTGGLGQVAEAQRARLVQQKKDGQELSTLSASRWSVVREFQRSYASRYEEDGNAHNYSQRASNLSRIFQQEYKEAAERALALQSGLKAIYGWDVGPLPEDFSIEGLDDFVVWVLMAKRGFGWRMESESVYDIVVPLVQPWTVGAKASGLIPKAEFDSAVLGAKEEPVSLSFDVSKEIFLGKSVRLRGFGLAFGNKFGLVAASGVDSVQTEDSFVRLLALVQPPKQAFSDGTSRMPQEITFGNVGPHQASQPSAYVEDAVVQNISPLGKWTVRLHPNIVWKEAQRRRLAEGGYQNPIKDLKFFFRVFEPDNSQ